MISLDTETTGVDFRHTARPYFITITHENGQQLFWEWDVDPLTREVQYVTSDLRDIQDEVRQADWVVLQNPRFDVRALAAFDRDIGKNWRWEQTNDTLMAGHLLASNQPHDLTSMALHYLGVDIQPHEDRMEEAVKECRRKIQSARLRDKRQHEKWEKQGEERPEDYEPDPIAQWLIAEEDTPGMPSNKGQKDLWKADAWICRAMAKHLNLPPDHKYWTVCRDYANADSAVTLALWKVQEPEIRRRGLWEIYEVRRQLLGVVYAMEDNGITLSGKRLQESITRYTGESITLANVCVNIAASVGFELVLPKSGNNKSLLDFCFGAKEKGHSELFPKRTGPSLNLPVTKRTDTGNPSLDKEAMEEYLDVLPQRSFQREFVTSLMGKRKRDTAVAYMHGYTRFMVPLKEKDTQVVKDYYRLHPNLNPTGTGTLRFSCSNPNEQNISQKEGFNLRYMFGPAPGREWWSCDAKNIERRLPAYEAGETDIIALFEKPDDPPYFGSEHLMVAHLLFPKEFEECRDEKGQIDGRIFKKRFKSTLYDRVKRFNFAMQYNCGEPKGDSTAQIKGAWRRFKSRFSKQEALNQYCINFANKHGYVETMPDRSVNPKRGYPIWCTRTEWGRIKPTTPLNYHVQGTACWWMIKAMIRCHTQLQKWNQESSWFNGFITMQVHDELVFDFPQRGNPCEEAQKEKEGKTYFRVSNLWRIRTIQRLMEQGGVDVGVPTPVSCEFHPSNYSEGIPL